MSEAELFRRLPGMNEILEDAAVRQWLEQEGLGRELGREAATHFLDALREGITAGDLDDDDLTRLLSDLKGGVERVARTIVEPHLRRVINATGVVVHTNLGRSPWSREAARRVASLATGYLNLEYDLAGGERGTRDYPVTRYLSRLLPGHAAAVVNNNAAAVLLVLNTLAEGREVVVSRGQLVEIGGSFRIPDVMAKGFCRLREVGATNRTRIDDFRAAIGPQTGLLLAVHPSNFRMVGFTESVALRELVTLGRETGVPVVEDLGSGTLLDPSRWGIPGEPTVTQSLAAGVDLVTFSGDKLLGGPQAGFVVGKPDAVARVRANPLYRAVRLDKGALLAIEATLRDYVAGRHDRIPTLAMLSATSESLQSRARELIERLGEALEAFGVGLELVQTESRVGGGAAPEVPLPSWGVAMVTSLAPDELARRLRTTDPPVIGRIVQDRLVLDVRALLQGDAESLAAVLHEVLAGWPGHLREE